MAGQSKEFLNQNRFKSNKAVKRLAKCRAGVDSNKVTIKGIICGQEKKF